MEERGWVFISHSHLDVQAVRQLRNRLESLGLNPLLFFLKCLTDDNEITGLIRREIEARDWFIYADSPNARKSDWVRSERDYIEQLGDKKVFAVDLASDFAQQIADIVHIARQMKVFIAHSESDLALADVLYKRFAARDMLVIRDTALSGNDSFKNAATEMITDTCRNGFVLLLITENIHNSRWIQTEVEIAQQAGGTIVPVYVGQAHLSPAMLPLLGTMQGIALSADPSDEELDSVVAKILRRVKYAKSDFRDSAGYRGAETIHLPPIGCIDSLTFFDCDNLRCVYIPDSVVYITPDAFDDHPDILVRCAADSYAAHYCRRHSIRWEATDDRTPDVAAKE